MRRSIIACALGVALMASTVPAVRAEPITLTVVAITGIAAVALSTATDMAVRNEDVHRAALKNDDRREPNTQAAEVKTIEEATTARPQISSIAVKAE
jgi:hypothetical protein